MFDAAVNQLRPQLVTIPGVAIPFPYGGKNRLISVDLDMQALQARGLAPADVVNAVNTQNLILPSGTAKFGDDRVHGAHERLARRDRRPERPAGAHRRRHHHLPARRRPRARRLLAADQRRAPGRRARRAAVGAEERRRLDARHRRQPAARCCRGAQALLPADIKVTPLFDQSVFVKAAIKGVVVEALIAAGLTAAMVLLFLGNWRSTLIIALTIPLSILASILVLYALGETLNLMTLGGLALSVGILVDQAIVTIENIERHLHLGTAARTRRSWSAPARSACRRSSRRCASASCSCRCSSSPAWRASCSCRWPRRWCSR